MDAATSGGERSAGVAGPAATTVRPGADQRVSGQLRSALPNVALPLPPTSSPERARTANELPGDVHAELVPPAPVHRRVRPTTTAWLDT